MKLHLEPLSPPRVDGADGESEAEQREKKSNVGNAEKLTTIRMLTANTSLDALDARQKRRLGAMAVAYSAATVQLRRDLVEHDDIKQREIILDAIDYATTQERRHTLQFYNE